MRSGKTRVPRAPGRPLVPPQSLDDPDARKGHSEGERNDGPSFWLPTAGKASSHVRDTGSEMRLGVRAAGRDRSRGSASTVPPGPTPPSPGTTRSKASASTRHGGIEPRCIDRSLRPVGAEDKADGLCKDGAVRVIEGLSGGIEPGTVLPLAELGLPLRTSGGVLLVFWKST